MVKVRITSSYRLTGNGSKACYLKVYLPAGEDGLIIPLLCDSQTKILGEPLTPDWGDYQDWGDDGAVRYREKEIEDTDWTIMEGKVDGLIRSINDKLLDVYRRNREEIKKAPHDKDVEYVIIE